MVFRIGIHVGDVVEEADGDLMGEGVNIAARIEGVCEPGGVAVSEDAWRQARARSQRRRSTRACRASRTSHGRCASSPKLRQNGDGPARQPSRAGVPTSRSIAVLPFENMSGDAGTRPFLRRPCRRHPYDAVEACGPACDRAPFELRLQGRALDVREVGRQLGARYVLEGGVRTSGNRIRINAQLIDASDGAHVWAERFDRALDDIFAVQDEITLALATEMQVNLTEGEQARLRYTTASNVEAWTRWVEGLAHYRRGVAKSTCRGRDGVVGKSASSRSGVGCVPRDAGWMRVLNSRFGWRDERQQATAKAHAHFQRALALDPDNADARMDSAGLMLMERRFDEAVAEARKALELAPGSADVANLASFYLTCAGWAGEALAQSRKAMTLNPNYPANYPGDLGFALRMAGEPEDAIAAFQLSTLALPGSASA